MSCIPKIPWDKYKLSSETLEKPHVSQKRKKKSPIALCGEKN